MAPPAKRKWTYDCHECGRENELVLDPNVLTWICFGCRAEGTFELVFSTTKESQGRRVGEREPGADEPMAAAAYDDDGLLERARAATGEEPPRDSS